jgi:fatty-acyl-CoA synthase
MSNMPSSQTIPALLEEQSLRFGDREAVVAGATRLTYQALRHAVRRAAKGFVAIGVQRGNHVAILMGNRPEWIVAFLALQQIGATAVGLNTWATPREMALSLAHAEVQVLIAVDRFRKNDYRAMLDGMKPLATGFPKLRNIVWLETESYDAGAQTTEMGWERMLAMGDAVADSTIDALGIAVQPDDVALLLYTSGSTAAPKGILLHQHHWIQNAWNIGERQHVTHEDRLWLAVSLFWSFGSVNALPNLLSHGACIVLQEHFDAEEALALIEREHCSIMYGTPNMVLALKDHPSRASRNLTSLRSGAMIGTPEQLMMAVDLGAGEICNVYGLSETYGNCAVTDAAEALAVRLQCVGQPLPGVTLRICHLETGAPLASGEVGEIRVQGPLFSAYYKDPQKTAEAYDADGFFHTGDLGMLDEAGRLYYRGRQKEMVKSGGINIAPIEVEETLMRHPAVRTAYVIGMPDPLLDEILVAIVIAHEGKRPDLDELKRFCKQELAAYKVPTKFRLATDDELPLTTTGKVQKMMLHKLLAPPSPPSPTTPA